MEIRRADTGDVDEIGKLYYDTIVTVNKKDYNDEQIKAWASTFNNVDGWVRRIEEQHFFVATIDEKIVGFTSLDYNGYLDLLYVHKDFQGQGIGTKLFMEVLKIAREEEYEEITVQSSITAIPFFEKQGFKPTGEKHKLVNGVAFDNVLMARKMRQSAEKN
ncbi:MAG TPA: GNAT family N-acetyltransferase [Bacteroidia bacterium]|jgi:putative acetyltransferase|nr:GNAT family N-acetyltransferase [Bacteroidia bacterium]